MAKGKHLERSIAIGEAMAAATLKRRRKAATTRKRALTAQAEETKPTGVVKGAKAKAAAVPRSAGVLVAEGDSWFDYPFHDVLNDLEDVHGFDVESVAHKGDTVEDMAYSSGQLDGFARRLEKVLRGGVKPRAILLSGGGNDVSGEAFALLLNHASSSVAGLNASIVAGVVDQRLRDAYVTILSAITAICQDQIGEPIPIIVHGYDYAVPDGRGVLGGWGPLPGPWLEPGFRRKGYEGMATRKQIVVSLIDRLNEMLARLAGKPPFSHVRHLDLRHTLPTGKNYKNHWANELHPTARGFEAVTSKFAAVL